MVDFDLYTKTGDWLSDSTHGFRAISPKDHDTFSTYFTKFFETRKWPRHYQSSLVLSIQPTQFLCGTINKCLCIIKRKIYMGNPVLYLILPPMHIDGNTDVERGVIKQFASYGVGTKLSEEDLAVLDLSGIVDNGNAEYIYEVTHSFPGKDYAKHRNYLNKVRTQQTNGELTLGRRNKLSLSEQTQLVQLTAQWKKDRLNLQGLDKFILHFNQYVPHVSMQVISKPDGCHHGFSITELVVPGRGCIPMRLHDYQERITPRPSVVLHCCDFLALPEGTLLNIGAGVGVKGLDEAKQGLKPIKVLQIYTYRANVKLTREVYNSTCQ